jgi:hypothetical protein
MSDNNYYDSEKFDFLPEKGKENPFAVPGNYFEDLTQQIITKIEVNEELSNFTVLSQINKKVSFEVPEDYFAANENSLEYLFELTPFKELEKIKSQLKKSEHPEYFANLDQKLINRIEITDELKEFSLLKNLQKTNNFEVDPEYFENIADRIKEKKYAEVNKVSLIERLIKLIFKPQMTLAYSIILIIGLGLTWYFYDVKMESKSGDCKTLACLEKNELLNEQNMRDFDDENLYDEVDVEQLDKQIFGEANGQRDNSDTIKKR